MNISRETARDELCALVNDALSSEVELLLWDDVDGSPPDTTLSWARVTVKHELTPQRTLGPVGSRKYTAKGTLWIQLFTEFGKGLTEPDRICAIIIPALRVTTTSGVVLRSPTAKELGADGGWQSTKITADFEYDQEG